MGLTLLGGEGYRASPIAERHRGSTEGQDSRSESNGEKGEQWAKGRAMGEREDGMGERREQWETKGRKEWGKRDPQALLGGKITGTHRKRRRGK